MILHHCNTFKNAVEIWEVARWVNKMRRVVMSYDACWICACHLVIVDIVSHTLFTVNFYLMSNSMNKHKTQLIRHFLNHLHRTPMLKNMNDSGTLITLIFTNRTASQWFTSNYIEINILIDSMWNYWSSQLLEP